LSSFVLGICLSKGVGVAISPYSYLSLNSYLTSNLTVIVTPLQVTEVTALQGGGLAGWYSLVKQFRLGKHFLSPLTISLLLCFVLL